MSTPERFVIESLFKVVDNRTQSESDFKLNHAQSVIDDNYSNRMILPKARREGVSTYFLARSAVRCLGVKNTKAVVISHDAESTERMLGTVKFFLDTMKGPKPLIKNSSKNEITFPKTNSMFYIGTAGGRSFGRGDTITDLHCSEVAYWPNAKKTMKGLLQAVPKATGRISIESTGAGAGDWYHAQCMRAAKGQSSFKLMFLSWQDFPDYRVPMSREEAEEFMKHLREDIDEPRMALMYGLTAEQLCWRRLVLEDELDGDVFDWNSEYPSCLSDCFQSADGGIFRNVVYIETPEWKQVDGSFWKLDGHPMVNKHYIIGADVGAGIGKDNSVAEIFCLETFEQVGEFISNKVEPDTFGVKLSTLGNMFNEAYIGCESNNHGILTLQTLKSLDEHNQPRYPSSKIYRTPSNKRKTARDAVQSLQNMGVRTTAKSKPYIIGTLRSKLASGAIIHSQILKSELSTFVEHEDGTMSASEGCNDDTVMAAAMATFVETKGAMTLLDAPLTAEEDKRALDFSFESIVKEMTVGRSYSVFSSNLVNMEN